MGRGTKLTSGYNALALCSLEQHAVVPFGFRRQVSSCSSNLSHILADCGGSLIARDTAHVASTGEIISVGRGAEARLLPERKGIRPRWSQDPRAILGTDAEPTGTDVYCFPSSGPPGLPDIVAEQGSKHLFQLLLIIFLLKRNSIFFIYYYIYYLIHLWQFTTYIKSTVIYTSYSHYHLLPSISFLLLVSTFPKTM
jgi:hypothetical protein